MRFFIDHKAYRAVKYLNTYVKHNVFTCAVLLKLSETEKGRRYNFAELNNYFRDALDDPRALVFHFTNKDVLILSAQVTEETLSKICAYFGLSTSVADIKFKLPQDGARLSTLIGAYMQDPEPQALSAQVSQSIKSKRERFLKLQVDAEIQATIKKLRMARQDPVVLVVDDDPFTTKLISASLCKTHQVHQAHDGVDGFKTYAHLAPDIIFLDISMPSISGFDFLSKIFQLDPDAYVVIISATQTALSEEKARRAGAKGFISKPFSKADLYRYIDQVQHVYA